MPSSSVGDPLEALFPEEGFEDSEDDQEEDLEVNHFKRVLGTDWQASPAAWSGLVMQARRLCVGGR